MTEQESRGSQDWIPTLEPYKPARVRYLLAFSVLGILILDLVLVFVLVFVHTLLPSEVDAFAAALLVPVIGLVGPVMGFYFGSNSDE
jgi:hypothetical protein